MNAQMIAPDIATEMAEEVRRTIGPEAVVVARCSDEPCCNIASSAWSNYWQSVCFLCSMMQVGSEDSGTCKNEALLTLCLFRPLRGTIEFLAHDVNRRMLVCQKSRDSLIARPASSTRQTL